MFHLLLIRARAFQLKYKWFFFSTEMVFLLNRNASTRRNETKKYTHTYNYHIISSWKGIFEWTHSPRDLFVSTGKNQFLSHLPMVEKEFNRYLSKSYWLLLVKGEMDELLLLEFYSFPLDKIRFPHKLILKSFQLLLEKGEMDEGILLEFYAFVIDFCFTWMGFKKPFLLDFLECEAFLLEVEQYPTFLEIWSTPHTSEAMP